MKLKYLLTATLLVATFTGCGASNTASNGGATSSAPVTKTAQITGSGSSALLPLAQNAAEKYKSKNANVSITLNGGGSGTGLKQVVDGTVDIGNSDVYAEEKLDSETASKLVDHKVCTVTMAAIVNKELAQNIKSLTKSQLIDVFSGKVTNWKEVGGPDEKILLVTRPDSSGTRALFTKYALDGNKESKDASYLETDNSGELLETVKSNTGAVGYVALSYLVNSDDVTPIAIDGVEPTLENTYNGTYSVWGYEHMYTNGEPNEAVKSFINYITSDEYGKSMEEQGYGVVSKMKVER